MLERLRTDTRNLFPPRATTATFALAIGAVCALTFQNCGSRASMLLTSIDPSVMGTASIVVNDKAQYTQTEDVALELLPPRGLSAPLEMYVTNTPGCAGGGNWQAYEHKIPWRLAQNNQIAVVYAKFRPALGDRSIESFCAEGGIIHDNTPPELAMPMKPPANSTDKQAAFTLAALDRLSGLESMECAFEGETFEPCSENYTKSVNIGQHKFLLRAKDRAGNVAPAVAYNWVVLSGPPSVAFTKKPPTFTNQVKSEFAFSFTDPDPGSSLQRFECALDSSPYEPCQAIQDRNVPEGLHTLRVKGLSTKNLWSPEISTSWTIDLTPPVIDFPTLIKASYSQGNPISFSYAVTDAVSGVDSVSTRFGSDAETKNATFSGLISKTASGTSTGFAITAKDKAGNVTTVSKTWTVLPQDEMTLVPGVDTPPLKVLFMVDDSNSMSQSQKQLADGIKPMLSSLTGVRAIGRLNNVFAAHSSGRTQMLTPDDKIKSGAWTVGEKLLMSYSHASNLSAGATWKHVGSWSQNIFNTDYDNYALELLEIGATDSAREAKIQKWAEEVTNIGIKGPTLNRGLDGLAQALFNADPNGKPLFAPGDQAIVVLITDSDDVGSKGINRFYRIPYEGIKAQIVHKGYTYYTTKAWVLELKITYDITRDSVKESVPARIVPWALVGEAFPIPSAGWIDDSMDGKPCPSTDKLSFTATTALSGFPTSNLNYVSCTLRKVNNVVVKVVDESVDPKPPSTFEFDKTKTAGSIMLQTSSTGPASFNPTNSHLVSIQSTSTAAFNPGSIFEYITIKNDGAEESVYSFADDLKKRYGVDPATDKSVIQKGIRDLLNQRFGENGYRFTAIVNDGSCTLNPGQAVGTSFIQLANLLGSKGQVIPICKPELYGAALKQTGLELGAKVKSQLLIDRPNKGIQQAWIVKPSGTLVSLETSQYTFDKNILTIKDGVLAIGDLVKVKLIVE